MRNRKYGGLVILAAVVMTTSPIKAQMPDGMLDSRGVPGLPSENVPLPLGNPGERGFYAFAEMVYLAQTWTLGEQTVAVRGLLDSTGAVTTLPGLLIGSGVPALNTNDFGRRSFAPGLRLGLGFKTADGISITASYLATASQDYSATASLVPPLFRGNPNLSDTFLTAPVFNFPPNFAGPPIKTTLDGATVPIPGGGSVTFPEGLFYGIWNGASLMTINYTTRYTEADIGVRVPLFATANSRIYGLAGGRHNWFFERFQWRTVSYDINGVAGPFDAADYSNTLSQRMYGPYLGCGHEVYLGNRFAVSTDLTGALLLSIIKERAKYELGDETIQNKRSVNETDLVPSFGANVNLWWYPISGVQMRVGYQAQTFFNTKRMDEPISFNYGAIDPAYGTQAFRLLHGINVGIGLFF